MHNGKHQGEGISRTIREFLIDRAWLTNDIKVAESDSLLEKGVIDSMVMMELISFIEQSYGIHVEEDEMMPENFDSIASMASYIQSKQGPL